MLDLKVVIIGGGIAGLSAAIALKKDKKKVVVREKYSMEAKSGLAFMIHSKTLDDIQSLTDAPLDLTENEINKFILIDSYENKQKNISLTGWYAVKRIKLLEFLMGHLSDDEYHENSDFSHFKYKGDKAIAAVFKDGSIEYGDLFIGADGINSQVRKSVCETIFFPNEINEFVCIVKYQENHAHDSTFKKYQSIKKGMSFGFIPISSNEHVWFLQFNSNLYGNLFQVNKGVAIGLNAQLLLGFPKEVRELIESSDLNKVHLWNTQELKLLSSYYKSNVCLIGDAVHGSISLTSSGVNSGISSAIALAQVLRFSEPLSSSLGKYEKERKKENAKTIEYAQILKTQFNRNPRDMENYCLPLFK